MMCDFQSLCSNCCNIETAHGYTIDLVGDQKGEKEEGEWSITIMRQFTALMCKVRVIAMKSHIFYRIQSHKYFANFLGTFTYVIKH